jgi:predicted short-subunit dehydrogenase-like oxidoreductase (DUF2520 family)
MLPAMRRRPSVAIVGPGRLGAALIVALQRAHYRVREIVSRNRSSFRQLTGQSDKQTPTHLRLDKMARLTSELVWFCVPDSRIAAAAGELAHSTEWEGKIAFHSSGALASDELDVLRRRGAAAASVHPLMTFVTNSIPPLRDVPFAIEGDKKAAQAARRIVQDLGGAPFSIRKQDKAAYHAWGAFSSPLLIALLLAAEQVAGIAGISRNDARRKTMPIMLRTLANYETLGPARSFSGPIVRGDVAIVRSHLRALQKVPGARETYLALARVALRHLPAANRKQLERVLKSS